MKSPPHPGPTIKDACLAPLGLSVTQARRHEHSIKVVRYQPAPNS